MSQTLQVFRFGIHEIKENEYGLTRMQKYYQSLKNNGKRKADEMETGEDGVFPDKKKRKLNENGRNIYKLDMCYECNIKAQGYVDEANLFYCLKCWNEFSKSNDKMDSESDSDSESNSDDSESEINRNNDYERKRKTGDDEYGKIFKLTEFPKYNFLKITSEEQKKKLMMKPIFIDQGNVISNLNAMNIDDNDDAFKLDCLKLDSRLINELKSEGYTKYLGVQKHVIPSVIKGYYNNNDIALCAPTGSGKTLTYILPICHLLCNQNINNNKLKCLIVAPTRDLALQIYLVSKKIADAVDLKIALSAAQKSFAYEQSIIVTNELNDFEYNINNDNIRDIHFNITDKTQIDILVCTPGRLIDHLEHTNGFTLQNLQILVMDEADHLTNGGDHQNWLYRLYNFLEQRKLIHNEMKNKNNKNTKRYFNNEICFGQRQNNTNQHSLFKILVSATLTHNPRILSSLKLTNPVYFGSSSKKQYFIPLNIKQYHVIIDEEYNKMESLLSLLQTFFEHKKSVVVFCNSAFECHRVRRMIEICLIMESKESKIFEFSRNVSTKKRFEILREFKLKKISCLICTDAMSRGLDVFNLEGVINYNIPKSIEMYVHRIGRTARGTTNGESYTLIHDSELKSFNKLIIEAENGGSTPFIIDKKNMTLYKSKRNDYFRMFAMIAKKEQNGIIDGDEYIPTDIIKKDSI